MRTGQKIEIGRALRQNLTPAESVLWQNLRGSRLNGRKFRRQHTVGPFVVDFCCIELSIIIEIDGDVHAFREMEDEKRQAFLEAQGYRVLRFTNTDILNNLEGVLEILWNITKPD